MRVERGGGSGDRWRSMGRKIFNMRRFKKQRRAIRASLQKQAAPGGAPRKKRINPNSWRVVTVKFGCSQCPCKQVGKEGTVVYGI
jgi:hypothetical protein